MKKLIAVLLALSCMFALCACGVEEEEEVTYKDKKVKVPKSKVDAYEKMLKKKGVEKDITIKEM